MGTGITCHKPLEQIKYLSQWIQETLKKEPLLTERVIEACDKLSRKMDERYLPVLMELYKGSLEKSKRQLQEAKNMMSRSWLEEKMKRELGPWAQESTRVTDAIDFEGKEISVRERRMPAGVLFHISAGNMEGLPAYSVIEGLLTGNVNILKTPQGDRGLSIMLLDQLIKEDPELADYIYVFDLPSWDIESMKEIGENADKIVVWGGDEAVKSVRSMACLNTKIIEWGHKISFCYVTEAAWKQKDDLLFQELSKLAIHMFETNQLYCNSCQGIFLDTDSKKDMLAFGEYFLEILEKNRRKQRYDLDFPMQARVSYELRCLELERDKKVLKGKGCSVALYRDNRLEPSLMFGNCWVKPLTYDQIIKVLKPYKNYLHTAALISRGQERQDRARRLFQAGIVRVKDLKDLDRHWAGEPHDGEFPMQHYIRIVTM